jgi:hypothetical protein
MEKMLSAMERERQEREKEHAEEEKARLEKEAEARARRDSQSSWRRHTWYQQLGYRARLIVDYFERQHPGAFANTADLNGVCRVVKSIDYRASIELDHALSADNADVAREREAQIRRERDSRLVPQAGPGGGIERDAKYDRSSEYYREQWNANRRPWWPHQ